LAQFAATVSVAGRPDPGSTGLAGGLTTIKRLLLGKTVTLTIRGAPIKLEANAAAGAGALAEAFSRAKAAA
jgi:hypothetical protein